MKEFLRKHKTTFIGLGGVLLGSLLGPGWVWQLAEARRDATQVSVKELELSQNTRQRLDQILIEMINLTSLAVKLNDCDPYHNDVVIKSHAADVEKRRALLASDYEALEKRLAAIEGRDPRPVELPVGPLLPPTLWVEAVDPDNDSVHSRDSSPPNRPIIPCPDISK